MAAHNSQIQTVFLTVFTVFFSQFCLILSNGHQIVSSAPPLVPVTLYSESVCPYCCNFVRSTLKQVAGERGLGAIVRLRVVPYGNARRGGGGEVTCQHGPLECIGNKIESCSIHLYPNVTVWYPFIECLSSKGYEIEEEAPKCAKKLGLNFSSIKDCYLGPLGDELIKKNGEETDSLIPPHRYVPWLVVDGKPAYDDYDEVASLVCEAYRGPKPKICSRYQKKSGRKIGRFSHGVSLFNKVGELLTSL